MRTNQASGGRWTLAIVEPWLWSWPISWTGFVATYFMKYDLLWTKINWWPVHSTGTKRNWQQSNLSTLELCTLLPSRPMSACPSPHGDTLQDGKTDFDHNMKWKEFSTNNHASSTNAIKGVTRSREALCLSTTPRRPTGTSPSLASTLWVNLLMSYSDERLVLTSWNGLLMMMTMKLLLNGCLWSFDPV